MARKAGRPAVEITLEQIEECAKHGLSVKQAAGMLGVCTKTLQRRLKEPEYREVWERGPDAAQARVLGLIWRAAENGSSKALTLLAVNVLGWTAGPKIEQTFTNHQWVVESPGTMTPEEWQEYYGNAHKLNSDAKTTH